MKKRRGVALIVCLWVAVLVTASALSLAMMARSESVVSQLALDRMRAWQAAESGIDLAIAVLADDETAADTREDQWWDDPDVFSGVAVGEGVSVSVIAPLDDEERSEEEPIRYGLIDESAKMPLSNTSELSMLPCFDDDPTVVDALTDWTDDDSDLHSSSGAEGGDYESLSPAYFCKNAALESFDELLRVRGFDLAILYGEDWNANFHLDANEDDGDTRLPDDNGDGKLSWGLIEYATLYNDEPNLDIDGEARLHLDASPEEITTRLTEAGIDEELAQALAKIASDPEVKDRGVGELFGRLDLDAATFDVVWSELTHEESARLGPRININTASAEVLKAALSGLLTSDEIEAIIARRDRGDLGNGPGWMAEAVDVTPVTESGSVMTRLLEIVTVRSTQFTVDSTGYTDSGVYRRIRAVIDRSYDPPKVVSVQDWTGRGDPRPEE